VPGLAAKCARPFEPYDALTGRLASAKCCTTDLTLAEFKQLCAKMDGANTKALTAHDYVQAPPTSGLFLSV
jgi:glycerophosphoryl diester phosphodiesterase